MSAVAAQSAVVGVGFVVGTLTALFLIYAARESAFDVDTLHVLPVGDLVVHDTGTDQPDCVCGPRVELVERPGRSDGYLIIHPSLDGREVTPDV